MKRADLPECDRCGARSSKCAPVDDTRVRDTKASPWRAFLACASCASYLRNRKPDEPLDDGEGMLPDELGREIAHASELVALDAHWREVDASKNPGSEKSSAGGAS